MVRTIALGQDSMDSIRLTRSHFLFRTIDITDYTNERVITVTFVDGGGGDDTITRSAGNFLDDGFQASGTIDITGTASNNATYTITDSATQELTFATGTVTAESDISTTFQGGTGLFANTGEYVAPADFGLSVIDFIGVPQSENAHLFVWNRTDNGLVCFDEAYVELVDGTDVGTMNVMIVGY